MSQHNNNNNNIGINDKTKQKLESKLRMMKKYDKSQLNQPGSSNDDLNEKVNTMDDDIAIGNDDVNGGVSKCNFYKRAASPNADDSLADFKLPKLAPKPHPLNNKIKLSSRGGGGGGGKKRVTKRRKSIDKTATINQPSIESSFFKPPTAFLCPLCMKSFNDIDVQLIHSKNCATKNCVSTRKLLAAVELQERQAEERLAIGLPSAPFQQLRKKSFNIKKMVSEDDPDIQLAIALSESMREMEEKEYFHEALALAAESNEQILQMSSSQRKSTLQNFGFSTNKPIAVSSSTIDKPRRRKTFRPTVLQTRTQETRERLLSDRIAEVLIGNESITQKQSLNDSNIEILSLRSDILKQMHKPNSKLWNHSLNTHEYSAYYVDDLCEFIFPMKMEIIDKSIYNIENKSNDMKLSLEMDQLIAIDDVNNENCDSLASSWFKMVNSCAFSDVIILVKNNEFIYCHEIVLFTRCWNMQKDIVLNDENSLYQQRKQIHWHDINFSSAIAFLKFIYCGEIDFNIMENDEYLLLQVYKLAEKYKVSRLLNDLSKRMEKINEKLNLEIKVPNSQVDIEQSYGNHEINSFSSPQSLVNQSDRQMPVENNIKRSLNKSLNVSHQLHYSRISTSPDMFEDMDMSYNVFSTTGKKINENVDGEGSDVSITPVNQTDLSKVRDRIEINDYFDEKLCETPKKYLTLSSTCRENSTASNFVSNNKNKKNDGVLESSPTMKRAKSNLSAFIENIQKQNAKGVLDSDSESEISIDDLQKYRKNPFIVRNYDDNSLFTGKYNWTNLKNEEKSLSDQLSNATNEKKSALSLLEDDIRVRATECPEKLVVSQNKNRYSSDNEPIVEENSYTLLDAEPDDENESMYTKYKRTHRKNSISNYRDILKSFMSTNINDNDKMQIHFDNSKDKDKYHETNTTNKHEISAINKIRLAELSAFDIYNAMTASPPNSSLENSSKTKSSSSSSPNSPIDLTELSDEEYIEQPSINESMQCSNEELKFGNWTEETLEFNDWQPLTQSRFNNKSPNKYFQVNEDKGNNLSQSPLDAEKFIDLTQSDDEENAKVKHSPINQTRDTITENVTRLLKDYGLLDSTKMDVSSINVEKIDDSNNIALSSSSETESVAGDNNNAHDNVDLNMADENFHEFAVESDSENNFQRPSTSNLCINKKNVTFRSKLFIKSTLTSIKKNAHKSISNNFDDELMKITLNIPSPSRSRCSSVSPEKNKNSTRLLTRKSRSEGNFTPSQNNIKNNHDNIVACSSQLLSHLNLSADDCEMSFDILPRENYSAMSSPELNERLGEYGLRNQKRHRAVKLLNYIYDQMYPVVPEHLLTSHDKKDVSATIDQQIDCNDDDNNKVNDNHSESDSEASDNSSLSNSSEMADEIMKLSGEDEEYDENDVILVRECFRKLLDTDRMLYNKILRYEPIPLESIHEQLKNKGIKSKLHVLADYLDDECITFFIEFPKKRQRRIGKSKNKRK